MTNIKQEVLNLIPVKFETVKNLLSESPVVYYTLEGKVLKVDFELYNQQFLLEMDLEGSILKLTDDVVVYEQAEYYNDNLDRNEWKDCYNKLIQDIKNLDLLIINQGFGNDDYCWHEIAIDVNEFNAENFKSAAKIWSDYNDTMRAKIEQD